MAGLLCHFPTAGIERGEKSVRDAAGFGFEVAGRGDDVPFVVKYIGIDLGLRHECDLGALAECRAQAQEQHRKD